MKEEPGNRLLLADLLQASPLRLADGSCQYRLPNLLRNATVQAETHPGGALQITLEGLSTQEIDGLPDPMTLSRRLLRENLICLPSARYGFALRLCRGEVEFIARALICARLNLLVPDPGNEARLTEVQTAYDRGLLDSDRKKKADFRISTRSLRQKYEALLTSGYLPSQEWQLEALFARWHDPVQQCYTSRPLKQELMVDAEICLVPAPHQRGFRITDLFRSESQT